MADWKELARKWSDKYGLWLPICLATLASESVGPSGKPEHDFVGDHGNSLGYGQVWPRWHYEDAFVPAANDLGISISNNLEKLTQQIKANPDFSMAVAVLAIKGYWNGAPGSDLEERWVNFTYGYVGPQIPDWDLERRRGIWHSYSGTTDSRKADPPPPLEEPPTPPPPYRGGGRPAPD